MTRTARSILVVATLFAGAAVMAPRVEARGHVGVRFGVVVRSSYPWARYGYGWPYCGVGACYAGPYDIGGFDMNPPEMNGAGAIQLNVKPGDAEVWVDGKFVAEARDLDGYPSPLWLRNGAHRLVIYKGGYRDFDEKVAVQPGRLSDLKISLEKSDEAEQASRPDSK
jgi:PEGA domain